MIDDFKLNCELVCNKYNLFADDDSYQEFRQSIINAPVFSYDKNKLPFEDIKLRNHELDIDIRFIPSNNVAGRTPVIMYLLSVLFHKKFIFF